ncbi:MAG: hypothetical protein GWM92_10115 [Gemmatimonadetes bacterium]|nr:hypothetical protein [Gemmatimonadota bacterium]NIR79027.1 hypothetical protein [Gemmatimonadota bacterium]NIT87676.1 hypothetical protein [Gemmatimonadota bacterium]NIU31545.1 hypothetical protein [Gemmatimonadota bacterium]NIU36197.1 hypothetical protein [Gemmatimonadota bacterium]
MKTSSPSPLFRPDRIPRGGVVLAALAGAHSTVTSDAGAQGTPDFDRLRDRGPGVPVSIPPNVRLKLNNAFGITSKAAGWAPEVEMMISLK